MKMNLGSTKPIRFLALLITMTLIMGCMVVPTVLGEEGINTKYSFVVLGDTDTCQLYVEYMLNSEQSDKIDTVTNTFYDTTFPDDSTVVYYVVGEAGSGLLLNKFPPNQIFFFNACFDTENVSNESSGMEWCTRFLKYLSQGTDLYVYLLSDGSRYGEISRAAVANLLHYFLDAKRPDYTLKEVAENTYALKDASGNALGTLHVIDLDGVKIEYEKTFLGPWTYVCEDMMKRLGIVEE